MNEVKINWPIAFIFMAMFVCITFIFVILYTYDNPFEINFKSDDNVVKITDNFKEIVGSEYDTNINLQICNTKLDLYILTYGNMWGEQ